MKQSLFIKQLGTYFETHLSETRHCSPNTIAAYADSFAILFQYFQEKKKISHYRIDYKDFSSGMFDDFILWMERERNYSASSKKQRLSAITSFLKYASRRDVKALSAFTCATSSETPKIPRVLFPYFTVEEIRILLRLPDLNKKTGRRDMVLLSLLYESAARAQEICNLCVGDVKFNSPAKVKILGKGDTVREIPVSEDVARLIKYHLKQNKLEGRLSQPLFSSQMKEQMTPACIRNLIKKYVTEAKKSHPDLFLESKYSPHSFRHSKAVHMAEAGMQLIYIRNFLGHASIQSTEIYARVSQAAVVKALTNRNIPNVISMNLQMEKSETNPLPDFIIKNR